MTLIVITHIILAIALFFVINLLGHYSPSSLNYFQLTTFLESDEAPAFNYVIRVLTPTVYIILLSAFFYSVKLDRFTINIYLVSVYYVFFRTIFNLAINRARLINWTKHFFYSLSIIALSYFVYIKFIKSKTNLLPDFSNMANELWIIIVIFLYNFINNVRASDKNAQKRKDSYLGAQFVKINRKYSHIINSKIDKLRLRQIALAIIIYENFNRPKLFRIIENISQFFSGKPHTLGIMQFSTAKLISDKKSVELGAQKLMTDFDNLKKEYLLDAVLPGTDEYKDEVYQRKLIEKYNPDYIYSNEVLHLTDDINMKYYGTGPRNLFNP